MASGLERLHALSQCVRVPQRTGQRDGTTRPKMFFWPDSESDLTPCRPHGSVASNCVGESPGRSTILASRDSASSLEHLRAEEPRYRVARPRYRDHGFDSQVAAAGEQARAPRVKAQLHAAAVTCTEADVGLPDGEVSEPQLDRDHA